MGLPKDSETLHELIAFTSDEYAIPEWLPAAEQNRLRAAKDAGTPIGVGDQEWGAWGPRALTYFLNKTGEIRYALPREALYPIGFKNRGVMVRPDANAERFVTPETRSIHFYGRRMRDRIMNEGGYPPRNSLIANLLDKHRITTDDAPLPRPKEEPKPLDANTKRGRGVLNLTDLADQYESDRGSLRHRYTELYQMLFFPLRERELTITLVGLDGGIGVEEPQRWPDEAHKTLSMWRDYFPNAHFLALDQAQNCTTNDPKVTYHHVDFDDPASLVKRRKSVTPIAR